MFSSLRQALSGLLSVSLLLATPAPLFAATPEPRFSKQDDAEWAQLGKDLQLMYWARLQEEHPVLADFALGEPIANGPLWNVDESSPLADADPFFMRAQEWRAHNADEACQTEICYIKQPDGGVGFTYGGKLLVLNQRLTPVLETEDRLFLTADDLSLFQAKVPGDANPGEGFFFINKSQFARALKYQTGVPVFFFPLPEAGWTGPNPGAHENAIANHIVFYNHDKEGLPILVEDIASLERVQNDNLVISQTWSMLEGQIASDGVALPMPYSTIAFGLILSGKLPKPRTQNAQLDFNRILKTAAHQFGGAILPQASAESGATAIESDPSQGPNPEKLTLKERLKMAYQQRYEQLESERRASEGDQLDLNLAAGTGVAPSPAKPSLGARLSGWIKGVKDKISARQEALKQPELYLLQPDPPADPDELPAWRRWLPNIVLYGGKGLLALALVEHVDYSSLITDSMPKQIANVSMLFGGVLVASIALKYTLHRKLFAKKYPKTPGETTLDRINKEHKGILDEYTHGLWAATAASPQYIRHELDFLKDRYFPTNKILHKAWESTMGFMMRASSRLAMNWKTFYLGSIAFGMADAIQVGIDLLIFGPYFIHMLGLDMGGAATAAFVSSTILAQFVGYLQSGAHSYSQDVKTIHMASADKEARRKMAAMGKNPESPKNDGLRLNLTAEELEKRFKIVGLPGKDEFLYDPITFLEWVTKKSGYGPADELNEKQKKELARKDFVLRRRHWGRIDPTIDRALKAAQLAYEKAPSEVGLKVISMYQALKSKRSNLKAVLSNAVETVKNHESLDDAIEASIREQLQNTRRPTVLQGLKAALRGAYKHMITDATQVSRDLRSVMFLASTSGQLNELEEYFPKSWLALAGGNKDAARVAAEGLNRSFNSFMEFDETVMIPDLDLESAYGSRVQRLMARIDARYPELLADPFVREMRRQELMARLRQKDRERKAILEFDPTEPPKLQEPKSTWSESRKAFHAGLEELYQAFPRMFGAFERRQWRLAREVAAQRMADPTNAEDQVSKEWLGIAARFRIMTDTGGDQTLDMEKFAQDYKYRTIVAQEISRRVGLYVEDPEQSELVQKVVVAAAINTESQLRSKNERVYMSKLSDDDRRFYGAEVYSRHFIANYVDLAVRTDFRDPGGISGASPEFPGAAQRVRRATFGKPGGKLVAAFVRAYEACFRNEETSYQPTIRGWFDRNIPFFPDMAYNVGRNLRFLPFFFLISYPTSYYIWQIKIPFPMYIVSILLMPIHPMLVEINNRIMRNYDIKPMEDVASKLKYAFLHSTFTNPQVVLEAAFTEEIMEAVDDHVVQPVRETVLDCIELLTPKFVEPNLTPVGP